MRAELVQRLRELEHRVTALLRSTTTRWVGLLLGVAAIAALTVRLTRDLDEARAAVQAIGAGGLVLALVAMLMWQVAPITIAGRFGTPDAAGVWARAQLLKYVPVPASAVAGFVGSSVRAGAGTRASVGAMVRQTGALALGAATMGLWAVVQWSRSAGTDLATAVAAVAVAAVLVAWAGAARDTRWRRAATIALVGWTVAGAGLGIGLGGDDAALVGSAVLASWVAGQIVVPVPAGLGVRELTLVALVQHQVGLERALVIALLARLVHTMADVVMATVVLAVAQRRDSGREPDRAPVDPDGSGPG